MDSLTGMQVAGVALVGAGVAASYRLWRACSSPSSPHSPKKTRASPGSLVFFFNDDGSQCMSARGHNMKECPLEECQLRHLRTIKKVVEKAKSCVDVCLYNLTQPDLEQTLARLIQSGIRVRCVAGDREEAEREFVTRLRSEGAFVSVKVSKPPERLPFKCNELLMHHKFVIVDNKILITGSMNWTSSSFQRNYDHMLISVDPHLVKQFQEEFNYLYSTDNESEIPCTVRPRGDVPFQACFFRRSNIMCRNDANKKKKCAKDECMFFVYKSVLHRIVSATVSIDICVQQITVEDLSNELIFAHENGVKIRVISEETFCNGTGSQISVFIRAGIPVHLQTGDGSLHHKFIIVDGKYLLSGSLNWTMQGFFGNYENVLLISNKDVVSRFQTEFNRLWEKFPPAGGSLAVTQTTPSFL